MEQPVFCSLDNLKLVQINQDIVWFINLCARLQEPEEPGTEFLTVTKTLIITNIIF